MDPNNSWKTSMASQAFDGSYWQIGTQGPSGAVMCKTMGMETDAWNKSIFGSQTVTW